MGTGILSTAQKRGVLKEEHQTILIQQMTQLNKLGEKLGEIKGVHAMTDITGFGLAGHLIEMAEGSGLCAEINYSQVRVMAGVKEYLAQRIVPDATYRNWNAYNSKISFEAGVDVMEAFSLLPDPQTNGGLLIAVDAEGKDEVVKLFKQNGLETFSVPIGNMVNKQEKAIIVKQ